jgi:small subunit ribosomal protein S1
MVVAIDGPAGVGKSTVAKHISEKRKLLYLNSGNFYRAITLNVLQHGSNPEDEAAIIEMARKSFLELIDNNIHLNGKNVESELHSDQVDRWVAQHSCIIPVREIVNERLRDISKSRDVIMEGRDITTVVLPHSDIKIYMDATVKARSSRRFNQGISSLSIEKIEKNIEERDVIDKTKPFGGLKIADDAVYLDTSDLTIDQVCETVLDIIHKHEKTSRRTKGVMAERNPMTVEQTQASLQEEYLKSMDYLTEGQLVEGQVIEVGTENVFIDVGYKSEGKIPIEEFKILPKIGDKVEVVLVTKETKSGELIVSKSKADEKVFWKNLKNAFHEHEAIEGKVTKIVKGGFEVDLGYNIHAFNPISKMDLQRVEEPDDFLNMTTNFYVERLYSDNKINIIISRRSWLEEEVTRRRAEFFEKTEIGDEVDGTVKSFTSFGAFIDLGGFDGLLHINDMSWGHVTRPKDFVKKGDVIKLKVIRLDPESKKINLSLKHFSEDPWYSFEAKYQVDDVVKGKVTKLTDFGAFIELEEGIEGLAHVSELSWVKRIKHPKELLSSGDEVEAKILAYDIQQGKVSLGLKQVLPNPWDEIDQDFPIGMRLKKVIKKITNSGAFVELDEGIDGFIHIDDLSWTKKMKHPSVMLTEGEETEVMVINFDKDNRNIRLGVKQLTEDPWDSLMKAFPEKSVIEGEITQITDFGLFLKVQGDIEGLINNNNICDPVTEKIEEAITKYKAGDTIKAVVTEINPGKQRLSLSIRQLERKQQREELQKYIHKDDFESTVTLGDIIKNKEGDE